MLKSCRVHTVIVAVFICVLTLADKQPGSANVRQGSSKDASAHEPNHIFKEMIPRLLKKTLIPIRLPEFVPYTDDKDTPLYAILELAELDNYSIQLAWLKNCQGGNACHVGYIGGSKTPPRSTGRRTVPVTLKRGIKGTFSGFDCGAHCDDASLDWSQDGYHYGISLKAGDRKTLVRMANSAILGAAERH
jgi:hypothetical protein